MSPKWKPSLFVAPSSDYDQPWWLEVSFPYNADMVEQLRKIPGAHFAEEELGRKCWRFPIELLKTLRELATTYGYEVVGVGEE
jgi:hypothetical protein